MGQYLVVSRKGNRMIQNIDYGGIYFAAMQRAAGDYLKQSGRAARHTFVIRTVWYGMRYFNTCVIEGTREELDELYTLQDALVGLMCELSPADIVRAFPPVKIYKGPAAGAGGYALTMRSARMLGYDDCLGERGRVRCLLWNYRNGDIEQFNIKCQELVDNMGNGGNFIQLSE